MLAIDRTRRGLIGHVLDFLNLALVILILVLIAGYIFGADYLVGYAPGTRLSPQTLACVVLLTFVQTSRRAPHGTSSVLVGVGIGSQFARIMLPASVAVSYLIILVGERLFASGTLTLPHAAAVTAAGMAALMLLLVLLLASKINALESELRGLSLGDALTGLHNRRGFYLLAEQARRDARRAATPLTVLVFDADGLKKINDNLGHAEGSEFLIDIATLLRETFRGSDVLGRIGGDEFAVVTHGRDDELTSALRHLDDATEAANRAGHKPYRLSVSVGAVTTGPAGGNPRRALGTCGRGDVPEEAGEANHSKVHRTRKSPESGDTNSPKVAHRSGLLRGALFCARNPPSSLPPRPLEQSRQQLEIPPRHLAKLRGVHVLHRAVERLEHVEPAARDARGDEPPIVGPPLTHQQPEPLHPHEEPRDVRLAARHHPITHLARGQAVGPSAAEDPEHVVLRLRQTIRLEEVDEILHQRMSGAQHLQEDLLLEALERLPLLDGLPEVAHVGRARRLRIGA